MPRKKKRIVSLEVLEPNSLVDYSQSKTLKNFICDADDAEKVIMEMDRKERWKHEKDYKGQVKAVLAPRGTRGASDTFFTDLVAVDEIKLPASVKPSLKHVYKVYDYCGEKLSTEYGSQKDIVSYITKRVKTKYTDITYNGHTRRVEYSPKVVADALTRLEPTTSQLEVEPVSRSGSTDTVLLVSIFNNRLK